MESFITSPSASAPANPEHNCLEHVIVRRVSLTVKGNEYAINLECGICGKNKTAWYSMVKS